MFSRMLERMEELTPETGFNVVGVDTFEPPGEELFLVEHFETRKEAEAKLAKLGGGLTQYYIYSAE